MTNEVSATEKRLYQRAATCEKCGVALLVGSDIAVHSGKLMCWDCVPSAFGPATEKDSTSSEAIPIVGESGSSKRFNDRNDNSDRVKQMYQRAISTPMHANSLAEKLRELGLNYKETFALVHKHTGIELRNWEALLLEGDSAQ